MRIWEIVREQQKERESKRDRQEEREGERERGRAPNSSDFQTGWE